MSITIEKDRIIFERRDELTIFEPYGPDCIRCRSTKNSRLSDENWTLLPAKEGACFSIEGDEKKGLIGISFLYYLNPAPLDRNLEWDMKTNLCPNPGSLSYPMP